MTTREGHTPPKNLRVEQEPYPHLRDDEGCVLARDYQHPEKLAFILAATRNHAALYEALKALDAVLDFGVPGSDDKPWCFEDWTEVNAAFEAARTALQGVEQ